jgi:hypothetical protein
MFSQKFYPLHNFPYVATYDEWQVECLQHGVGTLRLWNLWNLNSR